MEMSFLKIGCAVIAGGAYGGTKGFFRGLRETQELTSNIRKTQ